jgi:hypothetical protein
MRTVLVPLVRFSQVILGCSSRISLSRNGGPGAHLKDVTFTADDEATRRFSVPLMRTAYRASAPRGH